MIIIFIFSNQNATKSLKLSNKLIEYSIVEENSGKVKNGARIDIRTLKFTHCDIIWNNVKRRCPMERTYKTYDEDYKKI